MTYRTVWQQQLPNEGADAVDVVLPNAGAEPNAVPKLKPVTTNILDITANDKWLNQTHSSYLLQNKSIQTQVLIMFCI